MKLHAPPFNVYGLEHDVHLVALSHAAQFAEHYTHESPVVEATYPAGQLHETPVKVNPAKQV